MAEIRSSDLAVQVYVDGSFATDKPDPSDVDLIIALPKDHAWDTDLRPDQYNVLSRRRVRNRYGIDVLVAPEGSRALEEYLAFFSQVRHRPGLRKGVIRLVL